MLVWVSWLADFVALLTFRFVPFCWWTLLDLVIYYGGYLLILVVRSTPCLLILCFKDVWLLYLYLGVYCVLIVLDVCYSVLLAGDLLLVCWFI